MTGISTLTAQNSKTLVDYNKKPDSWQTTITTKKAVVENAQVRTLIKMSKPE